MLVDIFQDAGARFTPHDVERLLRHSQYSRMKVSEIALYTSAANRLVGKLPLYSTLTRAAHRTEVGHPPHWDADRKGSHAWYAAFTGSPHCSGAGGSGAGQSVAGSTGVPPYYFQYRRAQKRYWEANKRASASLSVPVVAPTVMAAPTVTAPLSTLSVSTSVIETGVGATHKLHLDETTRQGGVLPVGGSYDLVIGTRSCPTTAVELLDHHPNPWHPPNQGCVGKPRVLAERHARLLLHEGLVHVGGADVQRQIACAPTQPHHHPSPDGGFSRALRVSWKALDWLGERRGWWKPGEPLQRVRRLREAWLAQRPTEKQASGTQGASGLYSEIGMGAMAGRGRRSFIANGEPCRTPFQVNGEATVALESALAGLTGLVAGALDEWWPEVLEAMHEPAYVSTTAAAVASAVQYPRPLGAELVCPGVQAALRSSATDTGAMPPFHAGSDLHTDKQDGTAKYGTWAAYACWEAVEGQLAAEAHRPNPYSDVAVLPTTSGGVGGVRWQTMHLDYLTILLMDTSKSLHGSVFPDDMHAAAACLPAGLHTVRAIHYPLRDVQKMIRNVGNDPAAVNALSDALTDQGEASDQILSRLSAALLELDMPCV